MPDTTFITPALKYKKQRARIFDAVRGSDDAAHRRCARNCRRSNAAKIPLDFPIFKCRSNTLIQRDEIISIAEDFVRNAEDNYFEPPIFAFGSADDELYKKFKAPDVIGSHFLSPMEWMPKAKTVISFFLPYTEAIKTANRADNRWPADEWLYGRYEGQIFLKQLMEYLVKVLSESGHETIAPALDHRYKTGNGEVKFTSNWSERHVAYACGLGTFGLSKGIITRKGMCGRLGSLLTELDLPKDARDYKDVYEYCTMCGVCAHRCPAKAISMERGKLSWLCSDFLDTVREKHNPRYGCGKCQVGVPCESGIPSLD
jgi:epoxyqueuosine reductase QueG